MSEQATDASDDFPPLERQCETCAGSGYFYVDGRGGQCEKCCGSGKLPTPAGEKVLSLMENHFFRMYKDLPRDERGRVYY